MIQDFVALSNIHSERGRDTVSFRPSTGQDNQLDCVLVEKADDTALQQKQATSYTWEAIVAHFRFPCIAKVLGTLVK